MSSEKKVTVTAKNTSMRVKKDSIEVVTKVVKKT
jgi:hypothetical protein